MNQERPREARPFLSLRARIDDVRTLTDNEAPSSDVDFQRLEEIIQSSDTMERIASLRAIRERIAEQGASTPRRQAA